MASLSRWQSLCRPWVILQAVLLAVLLGASPAGERLEQAFSDWRLRHFSPPAHSTPIVVLAIDEPALDLLGPWPWPRSITAELLERLFARYQPAAVGLDMVFPPGVPQDEDAVLARALANRPVVVGQLFTDEPALRGLVSSQPVSPAAGLPQFRGALASSVRLGQVPAGHINALLDQGGTMRRLWPVACTAQGCSPALSVRLYALLAGIDRWQIERGKPWQAAWRLLPEGRSQPALSLDERFAAIIPWRSEPAHRYVSAVEAWQGTADPEVLRNSVVLVGATAPALADTVNTPVGAGLPGVETHARFLGAWLDGQVPAVPALAGFVLSVLWLVQTLILLGVRQKGRMLLAVGLMLGLAAAAASLWLYHAQNIALPLAGPLLYPLLLGLILAVAGLREDRNWILDQIGSYLPAPLLRHFAERTPDPAEETRWTTVMYADLIGSTAVSRNMTAAELARWSNRAVDLAAEEVSQRGGIIDNVAGDGLMIYWREGSPAEQARQALQSALAIQQGLEKLNSGQRPDWPELKMGMGIHAGPLLAGSFGRSRRRYTILGEVANLAFRIERQTRKLPALQLISAAVAGQAHSMALRPLAEVVLDGSEVPVRLFAFMPAAAADMVAQAGMCCADNQTRPGRARSV